MVGFCSFFVFLVLVDVIILIVRSNWEFSKRDVDNKWFFSSYREKFVFLREGSFESCLIQVFFLLLNSFALFFGFLNWNQVSICKIYGHIYLLFFLHGVLMLLLLAGVLFFSVIANNYSFKSCVFFFMVF